MNTTQLKVVYATTLPGKCWDTEEHCGLIEPGRDALMNEDSKGDRTSRQFTRNLAMQTHVWPVSFL